VLYRYAAFLSFQKGNDLCCTDMVQVKLVSETRKFRDKISILYESTCILFLHGRHLWSDKNFETTGIDTWVLQNNYLISCMSILKRIQLELMFYSYTRINDNNKMIIPV
jgi:hypothetical protein